MKENWSDIKGFNGKYMISDKGRVWSNNYNKELKQIDNGKGYLRVNLCFNAKCKPILVHRLVAEHFLTKEKVSNILITKTKTLGIISYLI